jgi:hypothetical protein
LNSLNLRYSVGLIFLRLLTADAHPAFDFRPRTNTIEVSFASGRVVAYLSICLQAKSPVFWR